MNFPGLLSNWGTQGRKPALQSHFNFPSQLPDFPNPSGESLGNGSRTPDWSMTLLLPALSTSPLSFMGSGVGREEVEAPLRKLLPKYAHACARWAESLSPEQYAHARAVRRELGTSTTGVHR